MERRKSGFTLIELLVVIAIIAILAAILFPVFARVKNAARQSQCVSNLGQLSKATIMYASEHSGKLPRWQNTAETNRQTGGAMTWDAYVVRYLKNSRVFTCPVNCVRSDRSSYPAGTLIRSYSMPKNVSGVFYEMAPKSSMTVMLFEKGSNVVGATSDAVAESFLQMWGSTLESPDKFWHGRGKVFAFMDGHAKYVMYPAGPFSYDYPSFTGWSKESAPSANLYGAGWCGYQDNNLTGDPPGKANRAGANIPR